MSLTEFITSNDAPPQVSEIPPGFEGKFIIFTLNGEKYLTTDEDQSQDYSLGHTEIFWQAKKRIESSTGDHIYEEDLDIKGAHLKRVNNPDGVITFEIHGTSERYGECDKEEASKLLLSRYPEAKVMIT